MRQDGALHKPHLIQTEKATQGNNMATKIQIVFYSSYGHIYKMAEAIAAGARAIGDT